MKLDGIHGDTAISLNIRVPWERVLSWPTQSAMIWPKFFVGGGDSPDQLKLKVPRSGQIFIFKGEGGKEVLSGPTQTQSAKISPNFNWGGGYSPDQLKLKVPRSLHIQVPWERVLSWPTQSAKIWPNIWGGGDSPDQLKLKVPRSGQILIFKGGYSPDQLKLKVPRSGQTFIGGLLSWPTQTQSTKISPNFHWWRGGGILGFLNQYFWNWNV